jgi:hypothetical protein
LDWTLWGAVDLLPMGDKVVVAGPGEGDDHTGHRDIGGDEGEAAGDLSRRKIVCLFQIADQIGCVRQPNAVNREVSRNRIRRQRRCFHATLGVLASKAVYKWPCPRSRAHP